MASVVSIPAPLLSRALIRILFHALSIVAAIAAAAQTQDPIQPPRLRVGATQSNEWIHVLGEQATNSQVVTLSASSNLVHWEEIAVVHDGNFDFIDPGAAEARLRFYRASSTPFLWQDTNGVVHYPPFFKSQVLFPYDSYVHDGGGEGGPQHWIKFLIDLERPNRVFYAGNSYHFHHDFARFTLEPFIGIDASEFERISMFNDGRRLLRGTLLYPSSWQINEYGIQFVGTDQLPRELVSRFFELVRSTVVTPPAVQPFYLPTYDQYISAQTDRTYFESNGIPLSTAERWAEGDICYSAGWAIGRLKYFPATSIAAAYASGELLPQDILITDGVPAELPYVSGVITLTPATANSHAAILARSYGVPFVYFINEADRMRALALTNREVILQSVSDRYSFSKPLIVGLDPATTPETRTEILALKNPAPLNFIPTAVYGGYWADTEHLVPGDIKYFGGKAANYGLLRRTIPTNAPSAIAFSFDLWNEFLEQQLGNGRSLRHEISNRLAGFSYPPNVAALQNTLAGIRSLIRQSTQFTPGQQQAITNALSRFDRQRNIRFRSSTNIEDAESFSGAGLYDSYSGCLIDDQDGDTQGPSACDPTEEDERGVFRAIRRVFASFYNDNAVLERLRLGVDENQAGMAMLVHHSTPDPVELANGVATITRQVPHPKYEGTLVTQLGAVSVANPDGTALPEEIAFSHHDPWWPISFWQARYSSLVRYGERVMNWRADYEALSHLIMRVSDGYAEIFTNKSRFVLDLEYKKVSPGHLEIKQVREVPQLTNATRPPFLLNAPVTHVNFQGVYGGLWATHRLKSRWTLQTRNIPLTPTNLAAGIFTHATIEHLNGTNVQITSGPLSSFPNAARSYTNDYSSDRFTLPTRDSLADFELRAYHLDPVNSQHPFVTGMPLFLEVTYHNPPPSLHAEYGSETPTIQFLTNVTTWFRRDVPVSTRDSFREYTFPITGQGTHVFIRTSFWLGSPFDYGDRPPLIRFVETTVEGLTTEPIRLRGYWSQTFEAVHWAGNMTFLFEPRLEENLPPAQHAELAAADIAMIYLNANEHKSYHVEERPATDGCYVLAVVGLDGAIRRFSDCDFGD